MTLVLTLTLRKDIPVILSGTTAFPPAPLPLKSGFRRSTPAPDEELNLVNLYNQNLTPAASFPFVSNM